MLRQKFLSGVVASVVLGTNLMPVLSTHASGPYQETFIVTAYYSPLPDQEFYVTGSFEGDKRLNGNGTHGADATPVYPGMIAAPGTYAFGTRVSCPPYIDGEIHDRGGAIVKAGVRSNAHDRLDFWAGQGDEALKTALYWGKRTLTCTVYPPNTAPAEQYVSLPKGNLSAHAGSFLKKPQSTTKIATENTIPTQYQQRFQTLGYDAQDPSARIAFQIRYGMIKDETDPAAGNFGPNTKAKLDEIFSNTISISENLEEGDVSDEVRTLQELLAQLGYLEEKPTAIFGEKTKAALIKFQLEKGLIDNAEHPAAGYVGPGTKAAFEKEALREYFISGADQELITKLNAEKIETAAIAEANELAGNEPATTEEPSPDEYTEMLKALSQEWLQDHTPTEAAPEASTKAIIQLASAKSQINDPLSNLKNKLSPIFNPFDRSLQVGSKHAEVKKLQEFLKALGYYENELMTDYFGTETKKAVAKFQLEQGIVKSLTSSEAGIVGPKTVKALNAVYYQQEFSLPQETSNKVRAPAVHPDDLKIPTQLKQASTGSKTL